MKAYSTDLRERIVRAADAGLSRAAIAQRFEVGTATVTRYLRQRRDQGNLAPKPRPGWAAKIGPAQWPGLAAQVAAHPDATLAEHCAQWEQTAGVHVSVATMSRLLRRLASRGGGARPGRSGLPRRDEPPRR
ncbi:MAG: IS630 transposase-related protein, partial [Thermomicrobiales bacterium]